MKHSTATTHELIADLKAQVKKLQADLKGQTAKQELPFSLKLKKSQARFERVRKKNERDSGIGEFFLQVDVTAKDRALYFPLTVASSNKSTGFVYQIEGTAQGTISKADVECRGTGVTKITLGTILYAKIPAGKTGSFRILIEIRGDINKEFKIVIVEMNYKFDPSDSRYQKVFEKISSKSVRFN